MKLIIISLCLIGVHITSAYRDCRDLDYEDNENPTVYRTVNDFVSVSDGKACKVLVDGGIKVLTTNLLDAKPKAYYIRKLDLRNNSIEIVNNDPFGSCGVCIVVLDLSHNNITAISSGAFSGVPLLQKFDLSHNNITTLTDDIFGKTNKIDIIYLHHNQIQNLHNLTVLKNLTVLDVSDNQMKLTAGMFNTFPSLLELNLNSNNISFIPLGIFEGIPKLEILHLSYNSLKEFQTGTFSGISYLKVLNMSYNDIDQVELLNGHVFLPIQKIKTLILDGNQRLVNLNATQLSAQFPRLLFLGIKHLEWDCASLYNFFKECQQHYIDISERGVPNYRESNIHGIKCINTNSVTTTTESVPVELCTDKMIVATVVEDPHKEKLLSELKVTCVLLVGFICVVVAGLIYRNRASWCKRPVYTTHAFTNYKLDSGHLNIEDGEGTADHMILWVACSNHALRCLDKLFPQNVYVTVESQQIFHSKDRISYITKLKLCLLAPTYN